MNAPHVNRHLRPQFCPDAVLGLVAIIAREAAPLTSGSSSTADERDREGVDPEPRLSSYSAEERIPAPQLGETTLDGEPFSLSDRNGKLLFNSAGGTWCGPWRAETSDLVCLAREDAGRGVRFVGINARDNAAAAGACVKRFAGPYPGVEDDNGALLLNFRNVTPTAVVPSSVIVDRRGKVAAGVSGPVTYSTLGDFLEDEIAATGTRP